MFNINEKAKEAFDWIEEYYFKLHDSVKISFLSEILLAAYEAGKLEEREECAKIANAYEDDLTFEAIIQRSSHEGTESLEWDYASSEKEKLEYLEEALQEAYEADLTLKMIVMKYDQTKEFKAENSQLKEKIKELEKQQTKENNMNENTEGDIKDLCFEIRKQTLELGNLTKSLKKHSIFKGEQSHVDQHSEMIANIMLCYRHLEDARMRIGKVVQAYDGGTSVYSQ